MISWITTVILSRPRGSTIGREPWFRAIIRFWIRVESLNRPPTLLTIASSFSSSSIGNRTSATILGQEVGEGLDGLVEVFIHHDLVVAAIPLLNLPSRVLQAPAAPCCVV